MDGDEEQELRDAQIASEEKSKPDYRFRRLAGMTGAIVQPCL